MKSKVVYLIALLIPACFFTTTANAVELPPREFLERLPTLQRAAYYEPAITAAARREKVDANLIWTIAYLETRFRPWLTSPKRARGLMQFMPLTAAAYNFHNPFDPTASINAAAKHLKHLTIRFQGRADLILAAYNAGETRVAANLRRQRFGRHVRSNRPKFQRLGIPPYAETLTYVDHGLKILRILRKTNLFKNTKRQVY